MGIDTAERERQKSRPTPGVAAQRQPAVGGGSPGQTAGAELPLTPPVRLVTGDLLPAAVRILKGSRRDKDWKGVSKAIWLLDELLAREGKAYRPSALTPSPTSAGVDTLTHADPLPRAPGQS